MNIKKFIIAILLVIPLHGFAATDVTPSPSSRASSSSAIQAPQSKSGTLLQPMKETPAHTLAAQSIIGLDRPTAVTQAAALMFMSLLPFLVMILTSFVKIVVVLSLLRNALGVQQAPPNQVINGIAFLLSIYVMFPTTVKMYDAAKHVIDTEPAPQSLVSGESALYLIDVLDAAKEPFRDFLMNNSLVAHREAFFTTVYRLMPNEYRDILKPDDFMILVPSFIATQLKVAFEIGVLIYIPFFVIDLVVSNILLAMGMMMLSPVTISMPLKLFLIVMLDGWTLLIEGLVATFR